MIYLLSIAEFILTLLAVALSAIGILSICIFIEEQRANWKDKKAIQRWERKWELRLQQQRKRDLHRKEREKYPLFFIKEGIV